ncbi:hypothetical protein HN51_002346 [Arachis hypogaea]|uniref:Uncharacterized protein n=2 Tax=Arachis TaxID=3817 RepID=A0A445EMR5_ARAHY|nr:uncharacterized protein LOC107461075 [Arachis duranensis]XP_025678120.1 uncharacterized protein LOC112777927 [Arachis hypogaea]QHO50544.1 uncharacterized protein DS421_1g23360 [Arachis hypogaea]RYR76740.1 hypothetical protein Ahy_A01g001304 [Arachis hypogaea]
MMKPSFVAYLILLSLILTRAQGIRVIMEHNKQHKEEESAALLKRSNIGCKFKEEEECTGKIKNRKLVTTTTLTTISKNNDEADEQYLPALNNGTTRNYMKVVNNEAEGIKVNKQATSSKSKKDDENYYPDMEDIVEMDYSPARRKPPIHN